MNVSVYDQLWCSSVFCVCPCCCRGCFIVLNAHTLMLLGSLKNYEREELLQS